MKVSFLNGIIVGSFCLSGCHGIKPGVYPDQSEMKKGPGLFTGDQGEITLLSSQKNPEKSAHSYTTERFSCLSETRN